MRKSRTLFFALLFCLLASNTGLGASNVTPPTPKKEENRITTWMTMSLLGKNQVEIEYYFKDLEQKDLDKLRERIRKAVMGNLRRMDLRSMIANSTDSDDLNVIRRKVLTEIRYMGMENDEELQVTIKEEFGVNL